MIIEGEWDYHLRKGMARLFAKPEMAAAISNEHVKDTPARYVKALGELFAGVHQTPEQELGTVFDRNGCDSMIFVEEMTFFSMCAHHCLPFFGKATFAYLPEEHIVGLSKIPRLLDMYARRPQVQEKLGTDIVNSFQRIIKPAGCGIMIRAYHMCCASRGIKQHTSWMKTTALTGIFKTNQSTKAEFLASCNSTDFKVF